MQQDGERLGQQPEAAQESGTECCPMADPIAIVSAACRLPGHCMTLEQLWQFLLDGGIASSDSPPKSRFNIAGHFDGSRKPHTMASPGGMFIEDIDLQAFDAQFFNTNGADAVAMEPQQRQLLEVVYECLENGGVSLEAVSGQDIGCFVGSYAVDFGDVQAREPEAQVKDVSIGTARSMLSNRISHFLNIKGVSMTIDTACSSSLVTLDVACRYLRTRVISGAIVACANITLNPEYTIESGSMRGAISESGRCHTFDAKADGYVKSEAVNCILIKRLSDAVRDGDPIRAVIRGSATNSDGRTPGIASPSSEAQAAATLAAYANAGIHDLGTTGYLECHGTGTPAGDPVETRGIGMVFAPTRDPADHLVIGSVKSNIGHAENASGLSGLLKAMLAVESGVIPGNPTFIDANPNIDFASLRLRASRSALAWPRSTSAYRRAGVNSFGFGGTNSHVIVDSAEHFLDARGMRRLRQHTASFSRHGHGKDAATATRAAARPHVVVFSANTADSVRAQVQRLREHLLNPRVKVNLAHLAYTLSERRTRMYHRGFAVLHEDGEGKVHDIASDAVVFGKQSAETPSIGFVFTGQGAQWPQMGHDLLRLFPEIAGAMIGRLDRALQHLSPGIRPGWTLLAELTEVRAAEHLLMPEFSQPLVTALQLASMEVLKQWGIRPRAVVGHSSGEIAAACAAGFLTPEQAIQVAYLRGRAAKDTPTHSEAVGMLAVGIGPDEVQPYLDRVNVAGQKPAVQIACYNSPSSVTLAGTVKGLGAVLHALESDGHFARMLRVNLAYHSGYMSAISRRYHNLLVDERCLEDLARGTDSMAFFSSVIQTVLAPGGKTDAAYWVANMVSPVCFADACLQMMSDEERGADFLIEIGPSNALAGPVGQIKKQLPGEGASITYVSAAKRGPDSIQSLFSVAGHVFIAGAGVCLSEVNSDFEPSLIVDLPNYAWNHAAKYWHESELSKEWRFRSFIHHDLLGSKVPGTSWNAPTFRKYLRLQHLPWLNDHGMGSDVIFPGTGYIAMAIEAVYQQAFSTATEQAAGELESGSYHYQLRDIRFIKALVLDDSSEPSVSLRLAPADGSAWFNYEVSSTRGGEYRTTTIHSTGLVRLNRGSFSKPPCNPAALRLPLKHATPARLWYNTLSGLGYGFGPAFQKLLELEVAVGEPECRALVSLGTPCSKWKQSQYPFHPAPMDGCFQSVMPSCWEGDRSSVNMVLVSSSIDSLTIAAQHGSRLPEVGLSLSSSKYLGRGRPEDRVHYSSSTTVYDPDTGAAILDMGGMRFARLETQMDSAAPYPFLRLQWKPDLSLVGDAAKLQSVLASAESQDAALQDAIDLVAHKQARLAVLEINLAHGNASSLWLARPGSSNATRAACRAYRWTSKYADDVSSAEDRHRGFPGASFSLLDPTEAGFVSPSDRYDLVMAQFPLLVDSEMEALSRNVAGLLTEGGHALFMPINDDATDENGQCIDDGIDAHEQGANPVQYLVAAGLNVRSFRSGKGEPAHLACNQAPGIMSRGTIQVVRLPDAPSSHVVSDTVSSLASMGWAMIEHASSVAEVPEESSVLILDELVQPLLVTATQALLDTIKTLVRKNCKMVWVTQGAQMVVTNPNNAIAQGFFRVIRSEEAHVNIIVLDVESNADSSLSSNVAAIDDALQAAQSRPAQQDNEFEYAERGGIVHVPRILANEHLHQAQVEAGDAFANTTIDDFHSLKSTVRLITGKRGDIDSLHWVDVGHDDAVSLAPGCVEVDIYASSLNFKDVLVAMGIVPENEHLLGLDGAGTVTRVGPGVKDRHVGQRVAVFEKGSLANRVITPSRHTMALPDSLSFEEGATMPVVYVTSIEALYGLADIQRGQRVLIHSASGGVGIASIQLCQHAGCEIFATVGTEAKRIFLRESFGIPDDHIFSSRTTQFAQQILAATDGHGADVIINSLTGELLQETWRIVAAGGTMVEIGKHDILQRRSLPMEPFGRNASFRALDLSLKGFQKERVGQHLDRLSELLHEGHVKPINPIKVFTFDGIREAFRLLGSGKHTGKIVVSNGSDAKINIKVRPRKRTLRGSLNPNRSCLIVGGLKGLCGSLAIWLAKSGVERLTVMCRSACVDERSLGIIRNIKALGCHVDVFQGDVSSIDDVRQCMEGTTVPIGGIIHGAMLLRDRTFDLMTAREYHEALSCKVQGAWNLHTVSQELGLQLSYFTMLSSLSGIIGHKGQANYAGGSTFLDSLALYRRQTLGLPACSVDLGIIQEVGYLAEHDDVYKQTFRDVGSWAPINEARLRQILEFSVYQQDLDTRHTSNPASGIQIITGLSTQLPAGNSLFHDGRFMGLNMTSGQGSDAAMASDNAHDKELAAFVRLLRAQHVDSKALLAAAVDLLCARFAHYLQLAEPMEPSRPMSAYGIDSLIAVEFRNWAVAELDVKLSVLDITNAESLVALSKKIVYRAAS